MENVFAAGPVHDDGLEEIILSNARQTECKVTGFAPQAVDHIITMNVIDLNHGGFPSGKRPELPVNFQLQGCAWAEQDQKPDSHPH